MLSQLSQFVDSCHISHKTKSSINLEQRVFQNLVIGDRSSVFSIRVKGIRIRSIGYRYRLKYFTLITTGHRASNYDHRTPNTDHQISNTDHPSSNDTLKTTKLVR